MFSSANHLPHLRGEKRMKGDKMSVREGERDREERQERRERVRMRVREGEVVRGRK